MAHNVLQFLDIARESPAKKPAEDRIAGYAEIYGTYSAIRQLHRPVVAWPAAIPIASGNARSTTIFRTG